MQARPRRKRGFYLLNKISMRTPGGSAHPGLRHRQVLAGAPSARPLEGVAAGREAGLINGRLRGRRICHLLVCLLCLAGSAGAADWEWRLPAWAPKPVVPADNPMSAAKVEETLKTKNYPEAEAAAVRGAAIAPDEIELVEGDLKEGSEIVTNVAIAGQSTRPAATAFPGFGGPQRGGFPGGGFPGGGGGGGGRGR